MQSEAGRKLALLPGLLRLSGLSLAVADFGEELDELAEGHRTRGFRRFALRSPSGSQQVAHDTSGPPAA